MILVRILTPNITFFVGCDGCINWNEMGFGYSGFPGGPDRLVKDYFPEDKLTFGNNNGLQVPEVKTNDLRLRIQRHADLTCAAGLAWLRVEAQVEVIQ